MSVEQAFIDAINQDPQDKTTQLVYADWLEEEGDPRAEAWRVAVEKGKHCEFRERCTLFPGWNWYYPKHSRPQYAIDENMYINTSKESWFYKPFKTFFEAMDMYMKVWCNVYRQTDFEIKRPI